MNTGIIASRYATALLKLVDETSSSAGSGQSSGEVVVAQARAILNALETLPDLRRAITDPSVPSDKKRALLETVVSETIAPELRKFFNLLIRNGRIGDIALALKSFEDQYCQARGIVRGRLVLPSEPDEAARVLENKIRSLIESKTGKTLQLTTEVDETLIGGFVLEVEDKLLDASVSRQLERIRSQFVERNRRIV